MASSLTWYLGPALLPSQQWAAHGHASGCGSAIPWLGPSFQPREHPSAGDVRSGRQEHSCSSPAVLSLGKPRSTTHSPSPQPGGTGGAALVQPLTGQWALLHEMYKRSFFSSSAFMWAASVHSRDLPVRNPQRTICLSIRSLRGVAHGLENGILRASRCQPTGHPRPLCSFGNLHPRLGPTS